MVTLGHNTGDRRRTRPAARTRGRHREWCNSHGSRRGPWSCVSVRIRLSRIVCSPPSGADCPRGKRREPVELPCRLPEPYWYRNLTTAPRRFGTTVTPQSNKEGDDTRGRDGHGRRTSDRREAPDPLRVIFANSAASFEGVGDLPLGRYTALST
jgi:hypothetical protein